MEKKEFDVIVIGGGPGGYVAAIRAAQKGVSVALIEATGLGGTCLNRGCIPSKALIANGDVWRKIQESNNFGIQVTSPSFDYASMKERKDKLVEKLRKGVEGLCQSNKISVFKGYGKFVSENEVKVVGGDDALLQGKKIIIATGSEPRALADFPFDGKIIHDSTTLLDLTVVPKKLVVIGGGVIGCEFASHFATLGSDVTIIELLPTILSTEGKNLADALAASFRKRGIKIELGANLTKIEKSGNQATLHLQDGRTFEADTILVSVGRKLNSDNISLEKTGVIVERNGSISTNERMETNIPHIYAIGDVTGKWLLAHVASHQGIVAADNATGHMTKISYKAVPSVVYTHPEIGSTGLTLEKALAAGFDAVVGKFPFMALGKSLATQETEGFAQVIISKSTGQILGAQVMGDGAATMIAEMAVAIENELTIHSITETMHAHPTISEAWMEAGFQALDEPLHLPPKPKPKA
jgi:dihydrolipoamide dehydrogenase